MACGFHFLGGQFSSFNRRDNLTSERVKSAEGFGRIEVSSQSFVNSPKGAEVFFIGKEKFRWSTETLLPISESRQCFRAAARESKVKFRGCR